MVSTDEIKALVAGCLEIGINDIDIDTDMSEVPEWDSMRNVIILSTIEDTYGIMIPEDDIFDMVSISAITEEVNKLTGND